MGSLLAVGAELGNASSLVFAPPDRTNIQPASMQQASGGLRGLGPCPLPSPAPSGCRVLRRPVAPRATLTHAPLTAATSGRLAAALNGSLAKWQWPAMLATGAMPARLLPLQP